MAGCWRAAPLLLAHTNVLLAMFAGGALVTAARLKWDPSTYVVAREMFPVEYRVTAGLLVGAGSAMLVLAHLALSALHTKRRSARRVLFILYALLMAVMMLVELAWCGWMAYRLCAWIKTPAAEQLLEGLHLRENVRPILNFLGRLHPLPRKIKNTMEEAEADIPRNIYALAVGAALLALLQVLALAAAATLAACGSRRARPSRRRSASCATTTTSVTGAVNEKTPFRTAYRNGRIVIL